MPLFSTILYIVFNLMVALGLNYVVRYLGWIHHGEIIALYFLILAGRLRDIQVKFALAYRANPDIIEQQLRDQLKEPE